MGGRGRDSGLKARQLTIDWYEKKLKVESKIEESIKQRKTMLGTEGSGGVAPLTMYKKCACCGEYTIPVGTEYETCPICGWVDDPYQNSHPNSLEGENNMSLTQARKANIKH